MILIAFLRFYYNHYPMFIKSINEIIINKLRPQNEINLLKKIINNPKEIKTNYVCEED